jgi:cytochrome b561
MASTQHYDRRTVVLHWLTAAIVALLWCIGMVIDDFDRGPPRIAARSTHIVLGAILVVIVAARIAWRWRSGRRLPPANQGAMAVVEKSAHIVLYCALVALLLLGLANTWIRGDSLFGLLKIHGPEGALHDWKPAVENAHKYVAHTLIVIATLHALAALYHLLVARDGVMGRMRLASRD